MQKLSELLFKGGVKLEMQDVEPKARAKASADGKRPKAKGSAPVSSKAPAASETPKRVRGKQSSSRVIPM